MRKTCMIWSILMLMIFPLAAQASLTVDMANFKASYADIYSRISPAMADKMDELVQDVYNDVIANYKDTEPTYDQVNRYANRRLLRDENYEGLLGYLADEMDKPENADIKAQYETLLEELCGIIANAIDASNPTPVTTGGGGGGATTTTKPATTAVPVTTPLPQTVTTSPSTPVFLTDISNHWASSEIQQLAALRIVSGDDGGTFRPDARINRAEFAALLVRSLGLDGKMVVTGQFQDVPADAWYFKAVNQAAEAGLVQGFTATTFGPGSDITREQMTVMIVRALKYKGKGAELTAQESQELLQRFQDRNGIASWAQSSVATAVQAGIIQGRSADIYAPGANASRAEAAVLILRLYNQVSV